MGALSLPSTRAARSRTSPGRVSERQTLPLLGLGRRRSRRTQRAFGTAMRLCVSLSRGVAAPLGCVIFFASAEVAACTPCAQCFPNVQDEGWYHYPRRALRAAETPDGRLSKRLICRFLRSGGRSSPHDSYFLANTQNFLLAVPVANAFALWYDKFSKLEFVLLVIIFGGLFFPVCHNIFNHCNTLIFSSSFIIFLHIAENMSAWF